MEENNNQEKHEKREENIVNVKSDEKVEDSSEDNIRVSKTEVNKVEPPVVHHENKSENEIINLRLDKTIAKIKKNKNLITYAILAVIVWIAVSIRTLNVARLKDITTNDWTLGPDLDPFLFLRWAKEIVENGTLYAVDVMRNVPLGFDTIKESQLLSQMIAWLFHILNILPNSIIRLLPGSPSEITVTYSAIIFPVVMFLFTVIAFFLLTRKIFYNSFENKIYPNAIALIASFFLSVIPSLLPRTIAGIPEKESAAFLFIFLAFYFLIRTLETKKNKKIAINAVLAGISTGVLGLIWGGINFVLISIGIFAFIVFILGQMDKKKLLGYFIWTATFIPILIYFSARYSPTTFLVWIPGISILATLVISSFNIFLYPKVKNYKHIRKAQEKWNLPKEFVSIIIVGVILLLLGLVFLGPGFFTGKVETLYNQLVKTLTSTRFTATVAENRQPFFVGEWKASFGPLYKNIPIIFWLFIAGAIALFIKLIEKFNKKEKIFFGIAYIGLIFGPIFSRYSGSSVLNGSSMQSNILYFGGISLFLIYSIYILYIYYKKEKQDLFPKELGVILLLTYFFISILGARGAVRFTMVLVPPASMLIGYLVVASFNRAYHKKEDLMRLVAWIVFAIILIATMYSGFQYYNMSKAQATSFHPGGYQFQWQKAMQWVRDNTSEDAVFSHWWDYGYWIQSIGNRATVLDGGNAIVYWNHLLGRHVLTGPDDDKALEFLKTHKATHLLIDSTDIGKYSAFSSIGGDENNDRFSFIPTMFMDPSATQETRDGMVYVYPGGTGLDDDITFEDNGTTIYLAKENTGIAGVIIEENHEGNLVQAKGLFIQQGKQIQIPLRYLYFNNSLQDFGNGIEAGVFIMETMTPQENSISKNEKGALFYLSGRTVNSLLVRKFLFEEEGSFKLVHTQPHVFTEDLRNQGFQVDDFSYFQGNFLGPIKIWEIEYPEYIEENPAFLETQYPDARLI